MARFALLASIVYAVALASAALADPSPTHPTELEKRGPSAVHAAALMATSCSYCASCSSGGCSGTRLSNTLDPVLSLVLFLGCTGCS